MFYFQLLSLVDYVFYEFFSIEIKQLKNNNQNVIICLSQFVSLFIILLKYHQKCWMDQSRFSFGSVVDTIEIPYQQLQSEITLPYNPFVFDLKLIIHRSKTNYEQPGSEFVLEKQKTIVFCRKKKVQKQWKDVDSIPVYLSAEIISQKHFSINQNHEIVDENSKHGTYLWINHDFPHKIQANDVFLIAKQLFQVKRMQKYPSPLLQFRFQDKNYKITETKKLFLIGSHKQCDIIISNLCQFQVCINVANQTIFSYLDEEQCSSENGLWLKLRSNNKKSIKLQNGNLILVDPYIFKVSS